ncbi:VOC family protein [Salipaludibacillus agaradhaerens]|uniref:VOC family protein n=1 Tax=Salipaludibacillus agaradhaerens TaxID=76935 RepID=A0A9Q4G0K9_SALAG|nr:VOC family protein [Salipaludibacillus agaradhaerens]MCR6097998.1 VOC family protein [Salipaludibacillus agaradhaerens]MCR6116373.1 VOC family protein [Salipaludibacillus agaradhaerens]
MKGFTQKVTPFLTFFGQAEEAMNFYTSIFENSKIINITRYKAGEAGKEGSVMHAVFSINGQDMMCIDSNVKHEWTFTPAVSFYIKCRSDEEITNVFKALSDGGQVHMPLANYGFSDKFAWVDDRFGVSWQLNLES